MRSTGGCLNWSIWYSMSVPSPHSRRAFGRPILVGPSRKSFIGKVLDLPVGERVFGTAAAVAAAVLGGAHVVRVHDVREMVQVVRLCDAIRGDAPRVNMIPEAES